MKIEEIDLQFKFIKHDGYFIVDGNMLSTNMYVGVKDLQHFVYFIIYKHKRSIKDWEYFLHKANLTFINKEEIECK